MSAEKKSSNASVSPSIAILGLSFCMIFAASGAASNVATTFLQSTWQRAESVCYLCHASICLFVPYILGFTGARLGLILGASGYLFLVAAPTMDETTMVAFMAYKGFVSPILWTCYGVFKSENSTKESQGLNDSVFFTIYRLNQVLANLIWMFCDGKIIEGYVLKDEEQYSFFLLIETVAFASVVLVMLFAPKPASADGETPKKKPPVKFSDMFATFGDLKIVCVYMTYLSISAFTKAWILGDFVKFTAPESSTVGLTFGVSALVGSMSAGVIFDKAVDKFSIPTYGLLINLGLLALTYTAGMMRDLGKPEIEIPLYYAIAAVGGMNISGMDVVVSSLVGAEFDDQKTCVYAGNQLLYAIGSTIAKGLGGFVPFSALPAFLIIGNNLSTYEICSEGSCDVKSQAPLSLFNLLFMGVFTILTLLMWQCVSTKPKKA